MLSIFLTARYSRDHIKKLDTSKTGCQPLMYHAREDLS
jgi:hypothetical protein